MALLDSAVKPAVPVWSDGQNVQGSVATPQYPGPITEPHNASALEVYPGSPAGPPSGTGYSVSFFENIPDPEAVPGYPGDQAANFGYAAPQATFDSNAGNKYGNGPIADTHSFDTGGTYRTQHVPQPKAGVWWRITHPGAAMDSGVIYDETGKIISHPNGRINYDQYQGHDANGFDPKWIPYSERPIYLNIAHEPVPFGQDTQGAYAPGGQLGEVGPLFWTDESSIYEAPPDPAVNTAVQQQGTQASSVGFWG